MPQLANPDFLGSVRRTITMERDAITELLSRSDDSFSRACEILLGTQGRVVVTGMGKSGHIATKIAATLDRKSTRLNSSH